MATCGPDPFFVPVVTISDVPETGTARVPLTLTGTVNPGFASNTSITWSVEDAGNTGAALSGKTLNTLTEGEVKIKAIVANGKAEGRDFTQIFTIIFAKMYTVSFETNGGSSIGSQHIQEGQKANRPVNPVKDGFVFDNWYIDSELTAIYNFDTPVTKDITLYAKWMEQDKDAQTPVASDFTFDNLSQNAGGVTAVSITPKDGKSTGARTIYYNGSITIPQTAGTYTVTFDVAAVFGWNAASGLSAGTLTVSASSGNNQTPAASDFTFDNLSQSAGGVTAVIITPKGGKSTGTITIYYNGSIAVPQAAGTYTVTFDVAAAPGWNAASGLSAGTLTVSAGYTGTTYIITNTAEWNAAITAIRAAPNADYILDIADPGTGIGIAGATANTFGTTTAGNTLSVALTGTGRLFLTSQGNMLRVAANQTLIIDSPNLTLEGLKNGQNGAVQDNNQTVVYVTGIGGELKLKNGTITGNTSSGNGGGVYVSGSTFTMSGGEISGNTASQGGGVYVTGSGSTFTMNGGEISGNTASGSSSYGGGVYVASSGSFTMSGGEISGNTANSGGGVSCSGSFTMNGGEISGNTYGSGGGVIVYSNSGTFTMNSGKITGNNGNGGGGVNLSSGGTFTMNGGEISGNTASYYGGGGVIVGQTGNGSTFNMVTGIIYGENEPNAALRNTVSGSPYNGAALYKGNGGTAEYGTFSGTTWNSNGNLTTSENTIKVANGVLQP
jgi:uncharacterized repeat protein (TIGR02543 family)